MSTVRQLIASAAFDPPALKNLDEIFEKVWALLVPEFPGEPDEIEPARIRIAHIVLDLVKDRQLAPMEITRTASRLMHEP